MTWSEAQCEDAGRDFLALLRAITATGGAVDGDCEAILAAADLGALARVMLGAVYALTIELARVLGEAGENEARDCVAAVTAGVQAAYVCGDGGS